MCKYYVVFVDVLMKKLTLCLHKFPYKTKYKVSFQNKVQSFLTKQSTKFSYNLTNNLLPIIMFRQPDSAIIMFRQPDSAASQKMPPRRMCASQKVPLFGKCRFSKKCHHSKSAASQKVPILKKCRFSESAASQIAILFLSCSG